MPLILFCPLLDPFQVCKKSFFFEVRGPEPHIPTEAWADGQEVDLLSAMFALGLRTTSSVIPGIALFFWLTPNAVPMLS